MSSVDRKGARGAPRPRLASVLILGLWRFLVLHWIIPGTIGGFIKWGYPKLAGWLYFMDNPSKMDALGILGVPLFLEILGHLQRTFRNHASCEVEEVPTIAVVPKPSESADPLRQVTSESSISPRAPAQTSTAKLGLWWLIKGSEFHPALIGPRYGYLSNPTPMKRIFLLIPYLLQDGPRDVEEWCPGRQTQELMGPLISWQSLNQQTATNYCDMFHF